MSENSNDAKRDQPPTPTPLMPEFKAPIFKDDKIVLYFHPYNFYSQKVLIALYEKNIDFTPYVIDLSNGEQYSSWFLNLNPKADVPVLQDGAFIIPDSNHILSYVESKFKGAKHASLKPRDPDSAVFEKIMLYERILGRLPVGALSLGSFIHDDLKLVPKPPFIGPIRKSCLKNNEKIYDILKKSVDEVETNKTALLQKLELQERRKELVYSRQEFQRVLDAVKNVLLYIEQELTKDANKREWLVANDFTLADISLGLLLHRLHQLGFENYYWSYGKLPQVESFFLRFKKRDSYQKLMPSNFELLKDIWTKTPANYKIGAGAGVIGMAMFAAFAHK